MLQTARPDSISEIAAILAKGLLRSPKAAKWSRVGVAPAVFAAGWGCPSWEEHRLQGGALWARRSPPIPAKLVIYRVRLFGGVVRLLTRSQI